jgi:DNA-binding NarL/FixJ family response regulator
MKKRILIVEDNEDMRFLYGALFRRMLDVEIISQVVTAEEALQKIPQEQPDLVIVDISLPGMSGIELIERMRRSNSSVKMLVVTAHDPDRYFNEARRAGADGLIAKGDAKQVVRAVKRYLDEEIRSRP